jgi:membrane-associated protease RseP (regulator of RpoE activity)
MGEVVSGIAYLLVILSLLVVAHELGHFGVARAF